MPYLLRTFSAERLQKRNGEPRCGELREKDGAKLQAQGMEELEIAKMRAESRAAKIRQKPRLEAPSNKTSIVPAPHMKPVETACRNERNRSCPFPVYRVVHFATSCARTVLARSP